MLPGRVNIPSPVLSKHTKAHSSHRIKKEGRMMAETLIELGWTLIKYVTLPILALVGLLLFIGNQKIKRREQEIKRRRGRR